MGVTVVKIYLLNKEKIKKVLRQFYTFSRLKEDIEMVAGKE